MTYLLLVVLHDGDVGDDVFELVKEPVVDLGQLVQLVDRVVLAEGGGYHKDPLVRRVLQLLQHKQEGRKEMFYLTTHSTHFIYGYMASDIW